MIELHLTDDEFRFMVAVVGLGIGASLGRPDHRYARAIDSTPQPIMVSFADKLDAASKDMRKPLQ